MIREYEYGDLDRILEIWLSVNIEVHNFVDESYWTGNYDMVREQLPKSKIYVYTVNNIIAGFIGINHGKIEGIFIDSKYRSQGIGKALIDKAKSENSQLELYVFEKNTKAREFYLREDFKEIVEEFEDGTGEMGILMRYND